MVPERQCLLLSMLVIEQPAGWLAASEREAAVAGAVAARPNLDQRVAAMAAHELVLPN